MLQIPNWTSRKSTVTRSIWKPFRYLGKKIYGKSDQLPTDPWKYCKLLAVWPFDTPPCINTSMVGLLVKRDLRSVGLCSRFLGSLLEVVTIYPYEIPSRSTSKHSSWVGKGHPFPAPIVPPHLDSLTKDILLWIHQKSSPWSQKKWCFPRLIFPDLNWYKTCYFRNPMIQTDAVYFPHPFFFRWRFQLTSRPPSFTDSTARRLTTFHVENSLYRQVWGNSRWSNSSV